MLAKILFPVSKIANKFFYKCSFLHFSTDILDNVVSGILATCNPVTLMSAGSRSEVIYLGNLCSFVSP
jgi:hypothetical protein